MKRYLFLLVFIALSWSWGVTVSEQVLSTDYPVLKGLALAMIGAGWIAFTGLRLFFLIGPSIPCVPFRQSSVSDWTGVELLPPDHNLHREPYIVK